MRGQDLSRKDLRQTIEVAAVDESLIFGGVYLPSNGRISRRSTLPRRPVG